MDAVRLHDVGDLRFEQIPALGAPEPGWVQIAVRAAGICGSDLHNFRTGQWITRRPSVAGHEFCGVVTAVGAGVGRVAIGDMVVSDSRVWCGTCPQCRAGNRNSCTTLGFVGEVCDGGFAQEVHLPERLVHPCPPGTAPEIAAMAEPLAVALHAVRTADPAPGATVLVVGCGTIGGLTALVLSRLHDGAILVADRNTGRADLVARVTGATVVDLDPASIAGHAGEQPLRCAIEATGSVAAIRASLGLLGPHATLALVGISHGSLDLDPNILVEREITLRGCHAFRDELPEAIDLLAPLGGSLRALIDQTIALEDVPAAFERLLAGRATGLKTIIAI